MRNVVVVPMFFSYGVDYKHDTVQKLLFVLGAALSDPAS